ncbi:putative tudor domain-containing protein 5 [Apostichopus japonicus]|uniref:Putative tudor domain-containing protein 5 n=1 Tax=Stichopus japonicus TaxID=307972 RepID=A0A2G8LG18_STIJA|nr:putative tudor domain-containing protein 5 [Apostichopus japonicus]
MTDKAKLRDSVKKNVRALLISAPMGLSMREMERDYAEVICEPIPALQLGFNSAQDLLLDMPDVARPQWERGNLVLFGVADNTTKHIQRMVSRQRKDKAKIQKKRAAVNRSSRYTRNTQQPPRKKLPSSSFSSRSFRAPAVTASVPASLQSQVKNILKKHPAGISNDEFELTFYQYQNYNINFKKLGFQTLWEFFRAIPGVKASHTSKDEYDIFLVPGIVHAIPAGYEDRRRDDVEETGSSLSSDYMHKGQVRPNNQHERKSSSERQRDYPRENLPPRLSGQRMAPTNSRSPWALAGVPQPMKKAPITRGRGKSSDELPIESPNQKRSWTAVPVVKEDDNDDDAFLPIEQDVEAPFEKDFVEDIKRILAKHSNGLWSIELPDEYKKLTGKPLKIFAMGYFSVVELVSAMPDVVTVVREDTSDWKLYDARKKKNEPRLEPSFQDDDFNSEDNTLEEVKASLRELLEDIKDGILLEDLQSAYERKYSRILPLQRLGFHDIDSLVLLIPDVVKVVYKGHGKVYAFAERETQGIPKYDSKMAILCSLPQDAVGFGYKYRDSEMPLLDQYFEVYVSSVCTPHKMTIQLRDKEQNTALEELMDDLEAIYKYPEGERYFFPTSMIAVNQLCCALYLEDNNWHRAIITGVIDNDFVEVNYIDYGSTLQVPKSCLRLLKACFLKLPAAALDAKLANVEPLEDKWSSASRDRLLELTSEKPLIAYCTEIKNKVLSLFLCDTTTESDIHINDLLVQEDIFYRVVEPNDKTMFNDPSQGSEGTFQNISGFDPSDFVTTVEQIPGLDQVSEGSQDEYPNEIYPTDGDASGIAFHQERKKRLNKVLLQKISLEDMEEIEENNLNLEDILLTMKFLEGRRKRLLAVLSSDEGVNAVDDLDETETLIRHFEERKTKISQRKPKGLYVAT